MTETTKLELNTQAGDDNHPFYFVKTDSHITLSIDAVITTDGEVKFRFGFGWPMYGFPKTLNSLSQDQIKAILPLLTYFAEHGRLPVIAESEEAPNNG
jgi:hypothetical protein